jgi:hypothetical protein
MICVTAPVTTKRRKVPSGFRQALARERQHERQEQQRERQSVKEAHLCGAGRSERLGQLALRGVACRLRGGGSQRRRDPQR